MQVVEKSGQSLSRSFVVTVPAAELGVLLDARIAEVGPTLNLKGFRPGKVPAGHVRRVYGKALMSEVVEKTVGESSQKVLTDHNLRVAMQPDLRPVSDMEGVIAGREDLVYDLDVDVMPEFEPMDVSTLTLTRLVYVPSDEELAAALADLAGQNKTYKTRGGKSPKAKDGDQVLMDFVGTVDGVPFDGGASLDAEIVLGSGRFIPGFEAQLVGASPGAEVAVNVIFPEDYTAENLRSKAAVFAVTVKEVREPKEAKVDDALAVQLGMADLAALTEAVRSSLEQEYKGHSRFKLKRALLDALDGAHKIDLPPRMVDAEFDGIWKEVEKDLASGEGAPDDEGKSEETLKAEYRIIAERRVRLGLVLAEIGRRADVKVTEAELSDAMRREAMQYGAQAQQIFDLLRQNADMQNQMRAPLYEEKVVDLIVSRASVTDQPSSKEDLLREDDLPVSSAVPKKAVKPKKAKAEAVPAVETEAAMVGAVEGPKAKAPAKAKRAKSTAA